MTTKSMHDALDRLKGAVEHPPAWLPEPGETITGVATGWETVTIERDGEESRTCDVLTLTGEDGAERNIWTWHFVLRKELVGMVGIGDFVAINYRGRKAKLKGDGDYASYRVAVEKAINVESDIEVDRSDFQGELPDGF
jgi:hypothetical protein